MTVLHRRPILLWLISSVLVASCVTAGRSFRLDAPELIQMGVTTKADVQAQLGAPWRRGLEDGLETWTYGHYRYAAFRQARTRDLVLRFDERGVVVSYTYNTTETSDQTSERP